MKSALVGLALLATAPAFAQQPASTLDRIKQSGVVAIGYREAAVPFSFLSPKGQPVGYSIELCQAIVDELRTATGRKDLRIDYRRVTPTNRIDQVASGRVDLECGATTITQERAGRVAFSPIIFAAGTRLLVKRGSAIHSLQGLEGKTVAGVSGTTNARALYTLGAGRVRKLRITTADSYEHALAQLGTGAVDAVAADDILMAGLLVEKGLRSEYLMVGDPLTTEPYAIAFAKGDAAMAEVVNKAFARFATSGRLRPTYEKWFLQPLPSGGALGLPMNAALEDAFRALGMPGN
jgi:glutamate/aspartate transport system substrate-binding protein